MDYEDAKRQKLQQLQERQQQQALAEAEAKIDLAVRSLLSEKARERLSNVRLVNRELYFRTVQAVLYLQKAGQLRGKLQEEELKQLLDKLSSKREIRIKRK